MLPNRAANGVGKPKQGLGLRFPPVGRFPSFAHLTKDVEHRHPVVVIQGLAA